MIGHYSPELTFPDEIISSAVESDSLRSAWEDVRNLDWKDDATGTCC